LFHGTVRDPDPALTRLVRLATGLGVTHADLEQEVIAQAHRHAASAYDGGALADHADQDAHAILHDDADHDASQVMALGLREQLRYLRDLRGESWLERTLPHMAPPRLRSIGTMQKAAARGLVVFEDGTYRAVEGCRILVLAPAVIEALVNAYDARYLRHIAERYGSPILNLLQTPDTTLGNTATAPRTRGRCALRARPHPGSIEGHLRSRCSVTRGRPSTAGRTASCQTR
jgi:hypothetical protein